MVVSQELSVCVCVCHLIFSSNISYFIHNRSFIWIHFTIHPTFMLIDTPSKQESLLVPLGFTSYTHQGGPGGISHIMYYIWKYAVHVPLSKLTMPHENKTSRAMPGWCMCLKIQRICFLFSQTLKNLHLQREKIWQAHANETGSIRSYTQYDLRGEYYLLRAENNHLHTGIQTQSHSFMLLYQWGPSVIVFIHNPQTTLDIHYQISFWCYALHF